MKKLVSGKMKTFLTPLKCIFGIGKAKGVLGVNFLKDIKGRKKWLISVAIVVILISVVFLQTMVKPVPSQREYIYLPDNYMIFIESPKNEKEAMFVSMLTPIVMHNGEYHPLFLLDNGRLNSHEVYTINTINPYEWYGIVISNYTSTMVNISTQLNMDKSRFRTYEHDFSFFDRIAGFDGIITVSDFEESLWASSISSMENKKMVVGKNTYTAQEQAWDYLAMKTSPDYVVITNPHEYYKIDAFHIMGLSSLAGEVAAYHNAIVITEPYNASEPLSDLDKANNTLARGYFKALQTVYERSPSIEYVALVGSGSSVPQFQLADRTGYEADGLVSSDSVYGFLDSNPSTMDVAVGRIINLNVPGASNMLVRTYMFDKFVSTRDIAFSTGTVNIDWTKHASVWNGFQVADQRMQMTPGYFVTKDFADEGIEAEYMRTTGKGGWLSNNAHGETDMRPVMESGMFVAYRGHGSVYGTFYVYDGSPTKHTGLYSEELRNYNLPPQIFMSASCLNGKIWGQEKFSDGLHDIDVTRALSLNYLYAGGIGFFGATEVSYSKIGQDIFALAGQVTGNHNWDKNNLMYGVFWDGILNHESEHGSIGKAGEWAINRYISNHDNSISPLSSSGVPEDWKEISMYVVYGDPAFTPPSEKPGANDIDPWHNGPNDM